MNLDNRIWIALTVVICGVLVAGGWFLGAQPQLNAAAAADFQRGTAAAHNAELTSQNAALAKAQQDLPALQQQAALLENSIPSDTDSAVFIRGINSLSLKTGTEVESITFQDSLAYGVPPTPQATTTTVNADGASQTPATPAPSATPTPVADPSTVTGAPVPLTDALITAGNFVVVPVELVISGSWRSNLQFVHGLQSGPRLVLVTGVLANAQNDGTFKTTISASIYVLRDPSRPAPATDDSTDPTPSPTDTASPTDTPSPSDTPAPSSTPLPGSTPAPSTTPKP